VDGADGSFYETLRALVDTGASKCMIPVNINNRVLHLPKAGHDSGVITGKGPIELDWVVVPKLTLLFLEEMSRAGSYVTYRTQPTDISATDVKTWLGDDFVIGMNFIEKFNVVLGKDGHIAFEG